MIYYFPDVMRDFHLLRAANIDITVGHQPRWPIFTAGAERASGGECGALFQRAYYSRLSGR